MKIWMKVFLYSVVLFLILLNGVGIVLIEETFKENLQEVIKTAINKYTDIEYTLYLNADYLIDVDISDKNGMRNWIDIIVNGYSLNNSLEPFSIEVYTQDNKLIMTNLTTMVPGNREEINKIKSNEKNFIIRKVNDERYVFVSSLINLKNKDFKLILSKNIERVYENRVEDYKFFLIIDLAVAVILATGMYIISRSLTRPITRLSEASKEIAEGNYSRRIIESKNRDEIGVLEKNFNMMIEVIENNIKELNYMNQSKQRFIDSLNHEIKTPITSIIGYSELLLKSKINEETKMKALMYINSEAKRLELLNATLLKLILIREETVNKEKVLLSSCIASATNTLKYKLDTHQIRLQIEVDDISIYVDKNQIEVLLINLLDNAIKASKANDRIRVYGNYQENENNYLLTIQDDGIGIPKEDIDKILEPFYMVDKARTRKHNGIGLGLAICNEICMGHQIILMIDSEVGKGTEITLKFNKESIAL